MLLPCDVGKTDKTVYNCKAFWAVSKDLSKGFDYLSRELIIAQSNVYGFSLSASKLIYSYPSQRKQRTELGHSYNFCDKILFGVLQGSILGPISLNIFLSDFSLILEGVDIDTPMIVPYVALERVSEI